MLFDYLKESFARKIARRFTKEYPSKVTYTNIKGIGKIEFLEWQNPLLLHAIKTTKGGVEFFQQFIKPGDLCIDIGANVGDSTLPMALAAGKEGKTIAFDPNPFVFNILKENSKLNPEWTNIDAFPFAITETEEEFYYISSEASFANGGISKTKNSSNGKYIFPQKVKGISLADFLKEKYHAHLGRFSLIKIDAEGYDKDILKSIKGLLHEAKPVVIAECLSRLPKEEKLEIYNLFKELRYLIYHVLDFDISEEKILIEKPEDILHWKNTFNVLAIPKE